MRWLTNSYDFSFKGTATARIGIRPTKSWLSQLVNFKNAIWHFRKLFFKLEENATETYRMLQTAFRPSCMNRASVSEWHKRFKEGRQSVRDDERCGRSKGVNTPELNKGLGVRFLCWGFKGGQEEIPSEEANTLQIGSVAFPEFAQTCPLSSIMRSVTRGYTQAIL